ncbi:orotidine 5'-phosphate decarboxylase [Bacteroidia bacterium]|nr:orotidine 5'-phosphate decarboxylase [Bacteroidia bacterium]
MNRQQLVQHIRQKQSFLCVGLDTDIEKIPIHLRQTEDPIFEFNRAIIDATHTFVVAYKPNLAFYEAAGMSGLSALKKTLDYLRQFEVLTIADAKRGDIGNTATLYAKAFLDPQGEFNFDAITIAPYMGEDSVKPFLGYPDKWAVLLALTSNKGSADFQFMEDKATGDKLFEKVLKTSQQWGTPETMMYVVGATQASMLTTVRRIVPNHFLLVPGVGAQGGSLQEVCKYGMTKDCGLLVNASRSILYASSGTDFATKAAEEARSLRDAMAKELSAIQ